MKIVVDKEGMQVMKQLCDIALKAGGLSNFDAIRAIVNATRLEEDKPDEITSSGNTSS